MDFITQEIRRITNNDDGIYILDFWASWCGPCKIMSSVLNKVEANFKDITIKKINVENEVEVSNKFGIRSIPTLIIVKNNTIMENFIGVIKEEKLMEIITKLLTE